MEGYHILIIDKIWPTHTQHVNLAIYAHQIIYYLYNFTIWSCLLFISGGYRFSKIKCACTEKVGYQRLDEAILQYTVLPEELNNIGEEVNIFAQKVL